MTPAPKRTEIMKYTDKLEDNMNHRKKMALFMLRRGSIAESLSKRNNLAGMLITGTQLP